MNYEQPQEIDDVTLAFPAYLGTIIPPWEAIPEKFRLSEANTPWHRFQAQWFYRGLSPDEIPEAKPGIDVHKALRHLSAIQRSFEPKHEHKVAAVAWLTSLWFEEPKIKEGSSK